VVHAADAADGFALLLLRARLALRLSFARLALRLSFALTARLLAPTFAPLLAALTLLRSAAWRVIARSTLLAWRALRSLATSATALPTPAIALATLAPVLAMTVAFAASFTITARLARFSRRLNTGGAESRLGPRNQAAMRANRPSPAGGAAAQPGQASARRLGHDRRWLCGRNALDHRFLLGLLRFFLDLLRDVRLLGLLRQLEGRRQRLRLVEIVVAQSLDRVVRRLEMAVGHDQHVDAEARLDRQDLGALFVQQERRDVDRNLRDHLCAVLFIASSCRMRRM
jgi:hypothetical protein